MKYENPSIYGIFVTESWESLHGFCNECTLTILLQTLPRDPYDAFRSFVRPKLVAPNVAFSAFSEVLSNFAILPRGRPTALYFCKCAWRFSREAGGGGEASGASCPRAEVGN